MSDLDSTILNILRDINKKLNFHFEKIYHPEKNYDQMNFMPSFAPESSSREKPNICPRMEMNPINVTHINYPLLYPSNQQIVNIYGNIKEKEQLEKKEIMRTDDKTRKILAGIGEAAIALAATYVTAKDEYIKYYLSDIESIFKNLDIIPETYHLRKEFLELKIGFENWRQVFLNKTKKNFLGKVSCFASAATGVGGIFFASGLVVSTGFVGLTASGCYLLWRYMKSEYSDKDLYEDLKNKLQLFEQKIFQYRYPNTQASAPVI